ncbi:MAG: hypothetical protein CVU64_10230 [Deltaproteobacteria bacterium HGW-Deltaproteobacteria-21]|nr:MAG: hypothetical protein CVU64_10230 [Deltaproteobacteria bacterium HGW-Deltaproteobacteria-21]
MSFDAEKEISKLLGDLHMAQSEIGRTYFRWRKTALELAGPKANPLDVSLKAAEIIGAELGKAALPRLNWLKGEEVWMRSLAGGIAMQWIMGGAIVRIDKGQSPNEIFIKWERCPWPTYAKEYGVKMEEDVLVCDRILQSILPDVNAFFNVKYKIETQKAIPRGQGVCLRRLYKA